MGFAGIALAQEVTQMTPQLSDRLFPGFEQLSVQTSGCRINLVMGGSGPPLLLLHGYPQSHVIWHKVAPRLAEQFTVVAPDLRGYGNSARPPSTDDHAPYSKRSMATDQVEVMDHLGFDTFSVGAHDRGARVAHRMALDFPDRLARLALLDILPTLELYRGTDMDFARHYWHWFFLIQPEPLPETLLGNNAAFFTRALAAQASPGTFTEDTLRAYEQTFSDPEILHATCEDYRASAGIDLLHDEADIDRKIQCPLLVLWGSRNPAYAGRDILAVWRNRAVAVTGEAVDSGHFIPEEAPETVIRAFESFFGGPAMEQN
jgi:haloacetate dehalogenase